MCENHEKNESSEVADFSSLVRIKQNLERSEVNQCIHSTAECVTVK